MSKCHENHPSGLEYTIWVNFELLQFRLTEISYVRQLDETRGLMRTVQIMRNWVRDQGWNVHFTKFVIIHLIQLVKRLAFEPETIFGRCFPVAPEGKNVMVDRNTIGWT